MGLPSRRALAPASVRGSAATSCGPPARVACPSCATGCACASMAKPGEVRGVSEPEGRSPHRRPASPPLERVLGIRAVDQDPLDAADQVARDHHWSNSRLKWPFFQTLPAQNGFFPSFSTRVTHFFPSGYTHLARWPPASIPKSDGAKPRSTERGSLRRIEPARLQQRPVAHPADCSASRRFFGSGRAAVGAERHVRETSRSHLAALREGG
jgi:hypothetical protein